MVPNLGLSAEHGSFVRAPQDDDFTNMTEALDMSWMSEVEEIFRFYMEVSCCLWLREGFLTLANLR